MSEQDTVGQEVVRVDPPPGGAGPVSPGGGDELEQPRFPVALRGYDRRVVDAYVDAVGQELRTLRTTAPSEQTAVRRALDQVGEETAAILQRAHDAADGTRRRADEEAARVLDDARRRATQMIQDAERHLQDLDADTDVVWQERMRIVGDATVLARQLLDVADAANQRFPPEDRTSEGPAVPEPGLDDDATRELPAPPPADR